MFLRKDKTNLIFPTLASLTLTACGGGGGGAMVQPSPPTNRAPNTGGTVTKTMDEDSSDVGLDISTPTDADGDSLTITVTGLPTGGTLYTADGDEVTNGMTLPISQLTGLIFTPDANLNDDNTDFGSFTYSVSDGSTSTTSNSTYGYYYDFSKFYGAKAVAGRGVVLPAYEPAVFELKNPNRNIKGIVR